MVEKKYVDVNIFVYWLAAHPNFGENSKKWINEMERARAGEYITSTLTVYETLVILAGLAGRNLRNRDFVETIVEAVTGLHGLSLEPLTPGDMARAVELMNIYGLDYEDALHLAIALRAGAPYIISNDRDFDRTPLKRIF